MKKVIVEGFEIERNPILKERIIEYIQQHPNCTIPDLYHLDKYEQSVRKEVKKLIDGKRIKQYLVVVNP